MDDFDQFASGEGGPDDFGDMSDEGPSSPFDDWSEAEVPDEDDLASFDYEFDEADEAGGPSLEDGVDDAFDVADEFEEEPPAAESDETAYAATHEESLVAEADNPALFPPELDLDVPEPVDGYPWVDLDALGSAETEPWANTVETSDYAAADVDEVVSEALARFWSR
ncbi:MAG TPA: hypothetical protein VKZ65_13045 [Glycomyces sp.]|nr:hypothetical protein [Glycomyces sp.]